MKDSMLHCQPKTLECKRLWDYFSIGITRSEQVSFNKQFIALKSGTANAAGLCPVCLCVCSMCFSNPAPLHSLCQPLKKERSKLIAKICLSKIFTFLNLHSLWMEFKAKMRRNQPALPGVLSHSLTSVWVARFCLFSGDFVFVGV